MNNIELSKDIQTFVETSVNDRNCTIVALAGDASSRRYFRVVHGESAKVLMVWDPFVDDGKYPFLNVLSHFQKHNVQVPQVVAKFPKLGVVLLEDLGDLTLERKFWENQNQKLALPFYKLAIDELVKIHYGASNDETKNCVAFGIAFDTEKLLWELNYGREHLIEKLCQIVLTKSERSELDRIFLDICQTLDREEKYICHRDYHSRNLMLKLGKVRVIDFQDARMGPIQYDLVSLVHDSYVDLNEESRLEILEYYLQQAKAHRQSVISRDHFFAIFRLQMIQRCFKACGSFASFYNNREDTRYLKYLSNTIQKVSDTLIEFPQYAVFHEIVNKYGLLKNNYLNPTEITRK